MFWFYVVAFFSFALQLSFVLIFICMSSIWCGYSHSYMALFVYLYTDIWFNINDSVSYTLRERKKKIRRNNEEREREKMCVYVSVFCWNRKIFNAYFLCVLCMRCVIKKNMFKMFKHILFMYNNMFFFGIRESICESEKFCMWMNECILYLYQVVNFSF